MPSSASVLGRGASGRGNPAPSPIHVGSPSCRLGSPEWRAQSPRSQERGFCVSGVRLGACLHCSEMAGSPRKRARQEFLQATGRYPTPEETEIEVIQRGKHVRKYEVHADPVTEPVPAKKPVKKTDGRHNNKGASPERMRELTEKRMAMAAAGDKDALGGRPKTKFSRAEITERALERLEPLALKVLGDQVKNKDLDPSDRRAAAIKILEYRRGKPTQAIKVDQNQVTTIRFETAAWVPGMTGASSASLAMGNDLLELEPGDVEEIDDASTDD